MVGFYIFFGNPYIVSARLRMDLFQYNTYECCGMHTYHCAYFSCKPSNVELRHNCLPAVSFDHRKQLHQPTILSCVLY